MKLQFLIKLFQLIVRHSLKLLICMAVVWVSVIGLFLKGENQTVPQFTSQPPTNFELPDAEKSAKESHDKFIHNWSTPEPLSKFIPSRDIFHEVKSEEEKIPIKKAEERKFPDDYIRVLRITQVSFPYYYDSFIEESSGNIIAGVKRLDKDTMSFAKVGMKLEDYTTEEITKGYIKLKGQNNEVITLEFRKTSMTSDLDADLMLILQRKTIKIKKGDEIQLKIEEVPKQIPVLDISMDTVSISYDGKRYDLKLKSGG